MPTKHERVGLLEEAALTSDDQEDALRVTQQEGDFTDDLDLGLGDGADGPKVDP